MKPHPDSNPIKQSAVKSTKIPVVEEALQVEKKEVDVGKVRVSKKINEENLLVSVPVNQQDYNVQRVSINQYIETAPPPVRYEGDTMIIPVLREEVIVQKRLILVEELRITKQQMQDTVEQPVTLRKEEVVVEHVSKNGKVSSSEERSDLLWENQK